MTTIRLDGKGHPYIDVKLHARYLYQARCRRLGRFWGLHSATSLSVRSD